MKPGAERGYGRGVHLATAAAGVVRRIRRNRGVARVARLGLVGRGAFYLILAYLSARVALGAGHRQANANGALTGVAGSVLGRLLLLAAAVGFTAFAVARLAGAYGDRRAGRLRRLSTAGQALVYLVLAAGTVSFLLGRHQTGSEQQQQAVTARLLALPAGRGLVAAAGLVVLGVCAWQIRVGLSADYRDTLDTARMPRPVRLLTAVAAPAGIVARAATFVPIGGFLVLAALRANPRQAKGLDALLLQLARSWWGTALVAAVSLGFLIFAAYSFIEAGYRQVQAGH